MFWTYLGQFNQHLSSARSKPCLPGLQYNKHAKREASKRHHRLAWRETHVAVISLLCLIRTWIWLQDEPQYLLSSLAIFGSSCLPILCPAPSCDHISTDLSWQWSAGEYPRYESWRSEGPSCVAEDPHLQHIQERILCLRCINKTYRSIHSMSLWYFILLPTQGTSEHGHGFHWAWRMLLYKHVSSKGSWSLHFFTWTLKSCQQMQIISGSPQTPDFAQLIQH